MFSSLPTKSIGLDIGAHSVKAVQMSKVGGQLHVDCAGFAQIDAAQLAVDPIDAQAVAVATAIENFSTKNALFVGALPGQTVVIRYPRLPDLPDEKLREAIEREAAQNLPFELSEVYLDFVVLERVSENEDKVAKVLLVAAKHELIDSCVRVAEAAGLQYAILTVDALALADAAEACGFLGENESISLIDIGATSTIVHFVRDKISHYYRDVNWGTKELIQAITRSNRCDPQIAEQILRDWGKRKEEKMEPNIDEIGGEKIWDEKETEFSDSGKLDDLGLQSDFGDIGGSPLEPLEDELQGTSQGKKAPTKALSKDSKDNIEQILRTPLASLINEVRRSFDFYEHQMYERPVERVILSGGVSNMPLIQEKLKQELGIEQINIADPTSSQLLLGKVGDIEPLLKQPAQFMVAIGLAARGAMEL